MFELDLDAAAARRASRSAQPVSRLPSSGATSPSSSTTACRRRRSSTALEARQAAACESHRDCSTSIGDAELTHGQKSLAILVLMQDTARTLTDADIDATMAELLAVLADRFGATLRQ